MKSTFTNHLKTLMLGGAMALTATHNSQAAAASAPESSLDQRVAKVREALDAQSPASVRTGQGANQADAGVMWWRNAWGNGGGWHNWHNGWHNGGWGNWHNW